MDRRVPKDAGKGTAAHGTKGAKGGEESGRYHKNRSRSRKSQRPGGGRGKGLWGHNCYNLWHGHNKVRDYQRGADFCETAGFVFGGYAYARTEDGRQQRCTHVGNSRYSVAADRGSTTSGNDTICRREGRNRTEEKRSCGTERRSFLFGDPRDGAARATEDEGEGAVGASRTVVRGPSSEQKGLVERGQ